MADLLTPALVDLTDQRLGVAGRAVSRIERAAGEDGGQSKLVTRDLRKTYGSVVALARATLEVREGEFVSLLGPSGSGKTTLLMIVAGLIQPDAGEVWIDSRPATYTPTFKRDIGMVFQSYALFPHLTVFENIAFPLRMRRVPEAQIRADVQRILDLVRLPEVAGRLPRTLSGGQQQRIALARAIVYRPSIILMDEPLGALDKKLRDQMRLEIKELHTQLGITVLYVTHDQEEAMVMSDRICLMHDGQIVQVGSPSELYFRPETTFAADFLGEANLFEATVIGAEGEAVLLALANGATIRAPGRGGLKPADRIGFMVRPECISLLGHRDRAPNTLEGVLREVILVGGVTKSFVELPGGSVVSVTSLTIGPSRPRTPEARVRIGWPVEHTVLLADSTGEHA